MNELYLFALGEQEWRFTDSEQPVLFGGEIWTPLAIRRSAVESTADATRASIQVFLPQSVSLFGLWPGDLPTSLTIFREGAPLWKGRIAAAVANGPEVTLECESVFTSLRRPGLRARYSRLCIHPLYGPGCLVDRQLFEIVEEAASTEGQTYEVDHSSEADYFLGGMLEINGAWWFILGQEDDALTVSRFLPGIPAGWGNSWGYYWSVIVVRLYPGCNRTRDHCIERFDNVANFGGFPWLPSRNPFDGSIV